MMNTEIDFYLKSCKRRTTTFIVDASTNRNPLENLMRVLSEDGTVITNIDARILFDKNEFARQLLGVPAGVLVIENFTEVPPSPDKDTIISMLRVCFKRDYDSYTDNTIITEEWINHFYKTPISIIGTMRNETIKNSTTQLFRGLGAGGLKLTNDGLELSMS